MYVCIYVCMGYSYTRCVLLHPREVKFTPGVTLNNTNLITRVSHV